MAVNTVIVKTFNANVTTENSVDSQPCNSFVLECVFTCDALLNVIWYFEKNKIEPTEDSRDQVEFFPLSAEVSTYKARLKRKNVSWGQDSGLYEVRIVTESGSCVASRRVSLYGLCPPKVVLGPRVVRNPKNHMMRLEFGVTNINENSIIIWYKNGAQIETGDYFIYLKKEIYRLNYYVGLLIKDMSHGVDHYRCVIRNKAGVVNVDFKIDSSDLVLYQLDKMVLKVDEKDDGEEFIELSLRFLSHSPNFTVSWFRQQANNPETRVNITDDTNYIIKNQKSTWSVYDSFLEFKSDLLYGDSNVACEIICEVKSMRGKTFEASMVLFQPPGRWGVVKID
ncbi:unnamed protein product [Caenorhabditis auriculariae]|uniref:Ig-like domain-containing protein n=1 Tax=Caenorhabditis auriculariae TaxID=2777116 RepID=A0A8S1HGS0_9PELO|nr:unnamed protein product [Caenorhabditis auriculariae]